MKISVVVPCLLFVLASAPFAVAQEKAGVVATDAVETIVTVVDVDQEARIVTVRGPQGGLTDLVVGEDVKAYDEVEIGDTVTVQYTEGLAMRMIHQ